MEATHPASPNARDATSPVRSTLRADANTLRTRELLAQRAQEARAAESETPVDAQQTAPGPMKEGRGMDGMKGMKGMEGNENH